MTTIRNIAKIGLFAGIFSLSLFTSKPSHSKEEVDKNALQMLVAIAKPALSAAALIPSWKNTANNIADNLPDTAITIRILTAKLTEELPAIEKAITEITAKLEKLREEDRKEVELGEKGVSAVRALKYGISALKDVLTLSKKLAEENGVLVHLTELFRLSSLVCKDADEETKEFITILYNALAPMRKNLLAFIPQIEAALPGMEGIMDQLFGK